MIRKLTAALVAASCLTAGFASAGDDDRKGGGHGDHGGGGGGDKKCDEAKYCVKFATLAPPKSPWGKVFNAWKNSAEKKSKGEVKVVWLWNGVAGPESNVVGKIKSGSLTGAAVTAVGLSSIHRPIVALQMPGAFKNWDELDKARKTLQPQFDEAMVKEGFYVSGWGDVGKARTMSYGFAVKKPEDLIGKTPGVLSDDRIGPKIYETIDSRITPKPTEVVEILSLLTSHAINVLTVPALAAEQLQWASRLDHINSEIVSFGVGAMVLSQEKLDKLPAEHRTMMQDLGKEASEVLRNNIRKEDDLAYERIKKTMEVHDPSEAEKEAFKAKYKAACTKVGQALNSDVLKKLGYC